MKRQNIFVNFKRFDVPSSMGGVNRKPVLKDWVKEIVGEVLPALEKIDSGPLRLALYFPESQLFGALEGLGESERLEVGCQAVSALDVWPGENFGALTSLRPAAAMKAMGVKSTIIGHCGERNEKRAILSAGKATDMSAINRLLNKEILSAQRQGLSILYCVGEREDEVNDWHRVIASQVEEGLRNADISNVVIAYEPVWSIGPGKTPAGKEHITKVARLIKSIVDVPIVYGGGLKEDNARMLAQIDEINGGLVALTRFSGDIGFYTDEFLSIVEIYMSAKEEML